jgi:4'-phosphopantetheinyl transferase
MLWLEEFSPAAALPAAWVIATGEDARTRPERAALRRGVSRRIAALQADASPEMVAIAHDPSGRPRLEGAGCAGLSLSHATRGGVVAVALAEGPVGVDIEAVGAGPVPMQALHRAEQLWLAQVDPAERDASFAALWAAKEAYGKWSGKGLPETDAFALLPDMAGGWRVTGAAPARILTRGFNRDGHAFMVAAAL